MVRAVSSLPQVVMTVQTSVIGWAPRPAGGTVHCSLGTGRSRITKQLTQGGFVSGRGLTTWPGDLDDHYPAAPSMGLRRTGAGFEPRLATPVTGLSPAPQRLRLRELREQEHPPVE